MSKCFFRYRRFFLSAAVATLLFVGGTGCEFVDLGDVREMIIAAMKNSAVDEAGDDTAGSTVPRVPDGTASYTAGDRVRKQTSVEAAAVKMDGFKVKVKTNAGKLEAEFDGFHRSGKPLASPETDIQDEHAKRRAVLIEERDALVEKVTAERKRLAAELELSRERAHKIIEELHNELNLLRKRLAGLAFDSTDRPGIANRISEIESEVLDTKRILAERAEMLEEAIRAAEERLQALLDEYESRLGEHDDSPPTDDPTSSSQTSETPAGSLMIIQAGQALEAR